MNEQNRIHLVRRTRPEDRADPEAIGDSFPPEDDERSRQLDPEDLEFWRYVDAD